MIKKAHVTPYKLVYKSCRYHAPVRQYRMSKLANNREILYFPTTVLAEPSGNNSGRPGQNSETFFGYIGDISVSVY
jgi:hypothetical protein